MSQLEQFDVLVLGSGQGGQLIAWHRAQAGRRTALVERRWIGGSCPNIACMPSKTEVWSARVAHLAQHGAQFGVTTGSVTTDMVTGCRRARRLEACPPPEARVRGWSKGRALARGSAAASSKFPPGLLMLLSRVRA
jgi:choline dehydrogenase-like flavoprotein